MQIITVLTGEQKPDRWIEITEVQDLSKVKKLNNNSNNNNVNTMMVVIMETENPEFLPRG